MSTFLDMTASLRVTLRYFCITRALASFFTQTLWGFLTILSRITSPHKDNISPSIMISSDYGNVTIKVSYNVVCTYSFPILLSCIALLVFPLPSIGWGGGYVWR